MIEHGFPGQSWLTFRQALSLGGNVRKSERGTTVVYADRFSLATTLMVTIIVFQAGDGTHGAMPADEFDGDDEMVKLELDPFG